MTGSIREVGAYGRSQNLDGGEPNAGAPTSAGEDVWAERVAADARYQAFASNGTGTESCQDAGAPGHDYDRCVQDNIRDPVLFQRQATDADAVDSRDVRQGGLGDCHVLAPLAALAGTPGGRALIESAVVENKDAKGTVVSYTVTLHEPQHHLFGQTTFRDVPVTVDGPYVVGHARLRGGGSQNEVWPLVVEKAYAQYSGGYNKIGRGGVPSDVMTLLTGREATNVSLAAPSRWFGGYSQGDLQSDLAGGKMVVLSTKPGIGGAPGTDASPADRTTVDAHGLIDNHAYFVKGTEQRDGKLYLDLGNPWGEADPEPVPFDELTTWFSSVSVGSVP
jgi:hypothetical protein